MEIFLILWDSDRLMKKPIFGVRGDIWPLDLSTRQWIILDEITLVTYGTPGKH